MRSVKTTVVVVLVVVVVAVVGVVATVGVFERVDFPDEEAEGQVERSNSEANSGS